MNQPIHLRVESGPDQGLGIHVPPAGARLGRASANDIALNDPMLSRHHCRFEFHGDGSLWVVDLASANATVVSGRPVAEAPLLPGDTVLVGDSLLRVLPAAAGPAAGPAGAMLESGPAALAPAADAAPAGAVPPVVDLGFEAERRADVRRISLRPVLWTVAAVCLLLVGAAVFLRPGSMREPGSRPVPGERRYDSIAIRYEKVEADRDNIFRYEMTLSPGYQLAVRIDDLSQNRHVREERRVDTNLVTALVRDLESSGFFALDEAYEGIPREGTWNTWDLAVILDRRAHRCRVANRLEPDVFRNLRERLETFGKNELGIWAIQFSREKLVALSEDALTRARKKHAERAISYGNLAEAIQRYREAEFYLDTVDPKPEFYSEVVSGLQQAREELDRRYAEQRFLADRAINLQDWSTAATELRILRELIPDREDERHREATRKLLDVENRLKMRKRP